MTPPVILTMKSGSLPDGRIPEQSVTPCSKRRPVRCGTQRNLCNRPPADKPPRQTTLHLQPPVGLTQPGQTTGVAVDQRHNLTSTACSQSSGDIRKGTPGSPTDSHREDTCPPPVLSPRSRTTPLAHIAGRAPACRFCFCHGLMRSLLMER